MGAECNATLLILNSRQSVVTCELIGSTPMLDHSRLASVWSVSAFQASYRLTLSLLSIVVEEEEFSISHEVMKPRTPSLVEHRLQVLFQRKGRRPR